MATLESYQAFLVLLFLAVNVAAAPATRATMPAQDGIIDVARTDEAAVFQPFRDWWYGSGTVPNDAAAAALLRYAETHPDDGEALFWHTQGRMRGALRSSASASAVKQMMVRAAKLGHPAAQVALGCMYITADDATGDEEKGFAILSEMLKRGEPEAALQLGILYYKGLGPAEKQDLGKAEQYLRQAVQMGHKQGHFWLSAVYDKTGEVPQMLEELQAGASLGDLLAQKLLADLYRQGKHVDRDPQQELKWTIEAAKQGDMVMQRRWAEAALSGYGGLKTNESLAMRLYESAAQRGDTASRVAVIEAHLYGRLGLQPNPPRGLRLLKEWVELGSAEAQFRLGRIYQDGIFLPRDPDRATELFKAAAAQDHEGAKEKLSAAAATAPARKD